MSLSKVVAFFKTVCYDCSRKNHIRECARKGGIIMKPLEISLDLKAYQLASENTKYNMEGKAVVAQEDEWREETEWEAMYEQLKEKRN